MTEIISQYIGIKTGQDQGSEEYKPVSHPRKWILFISSYGKRWNFFQCEKSSRNAPSMTSGLPPPRYPDKMQNPVSHLRETEPKPLVPGNLHCQKPFLRPDSLLSSQRTTVLEAKNEVHWPGKTIALGGGEERGHHTPGSMDVLPVLQGVLERLAQRTFLPTIPGLPLQKNTDLCSMPEPLKGHMQLSASGT